MALEDLIRVLRSEADVELAALEAAGRTAAEAIRAQGEAARATRRAALDAERLANRRSAIERALALARHQARRAELEARARLLGRVFSAARSKFPGLLVTAEYQARLPAQLAEALECLGSRPGHVRCHPELYAELARVLLDIPHSIQLTADPQIGAGFKVLSTDGAVEIDATLDDHLVRLAIRAQQEVLARVEATL